MQAGPNQIVRFGIRPLIDPLLETSRNQHRHFTATRPKFAPESKFQANLGQFETLSHDKPLASIGDIEGEIEMFKLLTAAAAFCVAAASAGAVTVNAQSSIFGGTTGAAPVQVSLGGDTVFNITATGLTNCCSSTPNTFAEGSNFLIGSGDTDIFAANGVSGIFVENRQMFLAGVFVDSTNLPSGSPSADNLFFEVSDLSFTSLSADLNQSFFIGDGLTGIGTGSLQEFVAPTGADTLLLGFVDGAGFIGAPGFYGDNTGSLEVSVSAASAPGPAPVPLPAGLPMLLAGLGVMGFLRRKS